MLDPPRYFASLHLFLGQFHCVSSLSLLSFSYLYAKVLLIIGKSRQKSQKFPAVMIFRRSLVRELTATTIGLFLVLLAILFTNLVLRILARAAGGAVAPEGVLPLLGFATLFYLNILLSVALFLTVLLTLSRWYRDSEMIVC